MAENKGFDLSALIAGVSYQDTARQQIEYIPLDLIDPDPENFYSLDGLDELAGSIELLGLQQPLLLRPGQDGRYTVTSGHRRRAAILMIRDGGSDQFADGVPCIVDRSEASAALQKLKLLMANKDTRKMSSADENKQAEELENVLRELEDAGYTFPGRLRDWVSKLSGMSRSKLARLKVIREKLAPELRKTYYNAGKMNENCAYELAQMPLEDQRELTALVEKAGRSIERLYASDISDYVKEKKKFTEQKCPITKGETCSNVDGLLGKLYDGSSSYKPCRWGSGCCAKCGQYLNCKHRCPKLEEKAKAERARKKAETADERAKQKSKDDADKHMIEQVWARYGLALRRAGLNDKQLRETLAKQQRTYGEFSCYLNSHVVQALLDFENADISPSTSLPYAYDFKVWDLERLVKWADALGCSLDYLFMRSDDPEGSKAKDAAPAVEWQTGEPPKDGMYWTKADWATKGAVMRWDSKTKTFRFPSTNGVVKEALPWWPLPEV